MSQPRWLVVIQEINDGKDLEIAVSANTKEEAKDKVDHLLRSGFYCFKKVKEIKD